jgi:hypothetical protein
MTEGIYELRTGSQINEQDSLTAEYDRFIATATELSTK